MPLIILASNAKYPTGLLIQGSSTIGDKTTGEYTCKLVYSNGSTKSISPTWSLLSNNANASINASGVLTATNVAADSNTTIQAQYTDPDTQLTFSQSLFVTVQNNFYLSSITVSGPDPITGLSSNTYGAIAHYSDGTAAVVTPTWSTSGISGASISASGVLTLPAVSGNQTVDVSASYTEDGITKTVTKTVNIGVIPTDLTINGSTAIGDNTTSQYTATVSYSDGSSTIITPTWSLGGTSNGATVNSSGLVTVPDLTTGAVRPLNASYTQYGVTVTSSLNLSISNVYDIRSIEILGPAQLGDNTTTSYSVRITYTDDSTLSVPNNQLTWSVTSNTVGASINSSGVLTIPNVYADGVVTVNVSYTYLGNTQTAVWPIEVSNSYKITSLTINGSSTLNDNGSTSYTCTANYPGGGTSTIVPIWTLSNNEARASLSGNTVTIPRLDFDGRFTIEAEYDDQDQTIYATKVVEVTKQKGSVQGIQITGWKGTDSAIFDGVSSYAYASVGNTIWPGNTFNDPGYLSVWVDFDFGCFMSHIGSGTTAKSVYAGKTISSGEQIVIKTNFWQQNAAYRVHSITTTKPVGLAHLVVNFGDKKVWINNVLVGTLSIEYAAIDEDGTIGNGLWLGASPVPNSIGKSNVHYLMSITNLVYGSVNLDGTQVDDLYNTGSTGNLSVAPSLTAWYQLASDTLDYSETNHLSNEGVEFGSSLVYDNEDTSLRCIAYYADGTAKSVTASWTIDTNSYGVTINNSTGLLHVPELSGDIDSILGNITVNASYTEGSTFTKSITADIQNHSYLQGITIEGSASVAENTTTSYTCKAWSNNGSSSTVSPTWSLTNNTIGASLDSSGHLTVPTTGGRQTVTVNASYTSNGVTRSITKNITISNDYALSSLLIEGSDTVNELTQTQYACTALYNDASANTVLPTWSIANPVGVHSISSLGLLTTEDLEGTSNDSITVQAQYSENGTSKTATKVITVNNNVYLAQVLVEGPAINAGTSETYTCQGVLSNGDVVSLTGISWSVTADNTKATVSITSGGVFTASSITDNQTLTVNASVTYKGVTVSGNKSVYVDDIPRVLTSLAIVGPTTVPEEKDTIYQAVASYNYGATAVVNATWSVVGTTPAGVVLSGSTLQVDSMQAETSLTLKADYVENGVTVSRQVVLTVQNTVFPTAIAVSGSTEISDKSTQQYEATITYSDGTVSAITATSCSWSLTTNDIGASVNSSGLLTVPNIVIQDSTLIMHVSYADSGQTVSTNVSILVSNQVIVSSLEVVGPDTVEDYMSTGFSCKAWYPDGTYSVVVPTWSLHNNTVSATINSSGVVWVPDVQGDDTTLTIVATYQDGSIIITGTKDVTIIDSFFDIVSLNVQVTDPNTVRDLDLEALSTPVIESKNRYTLPEVSEVPEMMAFAMNASNVIDRGTVYVDDNKAYDLSLMATVRNGTVRRVPQPTWSMNITDAKISLDSNTGMLTIADYSGSPDATVRSFIVTSSLTKDGQNFSTTTTVIVRNTYYLMSLSIDGDASMGDNASQQLTCIANRSGTNSSAVTPTWLIVGQTIVPVQGSFGAVIDADGLLTIGDVGRISGTVSVRATYTEAGVTRTITKVINVANTHYPTAITINGVSTVGDYQSTSFTFTATYSDSSTADLDANSVRISLPSNTARVTHSGGGVIAIPDVLGTKSFTLLASYTENGVTVSANKVVTVNDTYYIDHMELIGPDTLSDKTKTTFGLNAVYTDGYVKAINVAGNYSAIWSLVDSTYYMINGVRTSVPGGTIGVGMLSLPNVPGTATKTIQCTYTYSIAGFGTATAIGTKEITINDDYRPVNISVTGNVILLDNRSYSFFAYAIYTDGYKTTITNLVTWALSTPIPGATWSNNVLTLPDVDQDYDLSIQASCVYDGSAITGELAVHVQNFYGIKSLAITQDANTGVYQISRNQYVNTFADNSTHAFYARATYTDNSVKTVLASWNLDTPYGGQITVNDTTQRAYLQIPDLTPDQTVVAGALVYANLTATYTEKGKTLSKTIPVYAVNNYKIYNLIINGPASVSDNSSTTFTSSISHTLNGPTVDVDPQLEIIYNTASAYIEGTNTLVVPDLPAGANKLVRLKATYAEQGVTTIAYKSITVVEAYGVSSLTVSGPRDVTISDKSTTNYSASANYPNGSSKGITPTWSISNNGVNASVNVYGVVSLPDSAGGSFTLNAAYVESGRTATGSLVINVTNDYYVSSLTISGSSSVTDKSKFNYSCTANYNDSSTKAVDPTWSVSGLSGVTISSSGVLTIPDTADGTVTVSASYTEAGVTVTQTKTVTVVNTFKVDSLTISGSSTTNDNTTSQYSCVATYSDATTKVITPTWTVNANAFGVTVDGNGLMTIPNVGTSGTVVLNASYTEAGVTVTKAFNVLVNDSYRVTSIAITGAASVNDKNTSQYTCFATYTDSTSTEVTGTTTWTLTGNTVGASISSGGLLTVPNVASASSITVNASWTDGTNTFTATKTVTIPDAFKVSSIAVSGSNSVDASGATTSNYTTTATYTDSTTASVTPTWSITGDAKNCSIDSGGVLTIPLQSSTTSITLSASYTEDGTTVTATYVVNLVAAAAVVTSATPTASTILLVTGDTLP